MEYITVLKRFMESVIKNLGVNQIVVSDRIMTKITFTFDEIKTL